MTKHRDAELYVTHNRVVMSFEVFKALDPKVIAAAVKAGKWA